MRSMTAPKAVVPAYAVAPVNAAVVVAASRKRAHAEAFVGNEENMPSPGPPTDVGAMLLMNFATMRGGCGGEMCSRSEKCAKGRGHSGWCNVKRAEPSPIAYDADEDDMPLHSDGSATE